MTAPPSPAPWPADPRLLRAEITAMLDSLLAALDERIPRGAIRGVYFKGSASKVWHVPCDYVPELSDLDLHVWLHDEASAAVEAQFQDTRFALEFAAAAEAAFRHRVPSPCHVPRPQVLILNEAMRRRTSWTRSHAVVLRGEAPPGSEATAREDRETLLAVSGEAAQLGLSVMDKLEAEVWTALRAVNWRVSPLPARLLSAAGAGAQVWDEPRSVLLADLDRSGFGAVAAHLGRYYDHAWKGFCGGWRDAAPMRLAILAALDALALAADHAGRPE